MKLEIASEDIVQKNDLGQNVVVVPAGQPIPENLDVSAATKTAASDQSAATTDAEEDKPAARRKSKA